MQDVVNSANNISSNVLPTNLNMGILAVPGKLAKPELYNANEAKKNFNVLTSDIYQAKDKISYEDTTKTPKGVYAIGAVLVAVAIGIKTGVFSKIKNILAKI